MTSTAAIYKHRVGGEASARVTVGSASLASDSAGISARVVAAQ
jgi:hypothetical protein